MGERIRKANIGDVFEVKIKNNKKAYFQYIGLDNSQLNSEVIKVFKGIYNTEESIFQKEIELMEVEFYTHTSIKAGIRQNHWEFFNNFKLGENFVLPSFKCSRDYGKGEIEISRSWYIWEMNREYMSVNQLNDSQKKYDLGEVYPPFIVVEQIENNGIYPYGYPGYE